MSDSSIQDFYAQSGSGGEIAHRIIAALRATAGTATEVTPEMLAPFDHVHARGIVGTRAVALLLQPQPGEAILDIGSGIGGPARWFAANYQCTVTGVDLTKAYCDAARVLNDACGLSDRIRIVESSATALPLSDAAFDAAYSQFALMNIADKVSFYREAFRVLMPGGRLVLFHLNAGVSGPPTFPLPWAAVPADSFLATDEETCRDLEAAGFEIVSFRDRTQSERTATIDMLRRLETGEEPMTGLHVLMGESYLQARINVVKAEAEGHVRAIEIVARRAG
jgi:ubiquinone/menaquinone biosynthesis C-methylase UbiE